MLRDIILVVGLVVMAIILVINAIGLVLNVQQIRDNIVFWGISWPVLIFAVFALAFCVVVGKLIYRLNKFERMRPKILVNPKNVSGIEIALVVHNKGNVPATFEAIMTCTAIFDVYMQPQIPQLVKASMVWETSGNALDTINADSERILKMCRYDEKLNGGSKVHYMCFNKVEANTLKEVEFAHYDKDTRVPKVKVDITISSNLPIKGQCNWTYEIIYVVPTSFLGIRSL